MLFHRPAHVPPGRVHGGGLLAGVLVLLPLLWPAAAAAQPALPRWDAAIMAAGFYGRADEPPDSTGFRNDNWFGGGQFGVTAGGYWSAHVKTEIEWSMTSEATRYVQRFVTIPNSPTPIPVSGEQYIRNREASISAAWQFLDNAWVHPYVLAGVALDFERVRARRFSQAVFGSPSQGGTQIVTVEFAEGPVTTRRARGMLGAGAKVYMTPKTFFRAEMRGAVSPRVEHVTFRAGIGMDF